MGNLSKSIRYNNPAILSSSAVSAILESSACTHPPRCASDEQLANYLCCVVQFCYPSVRQSLHLLTFPKLPHKQPDFAHHRQSSTVRLTIQRTHHAASLVIDTSVGLSVRLKYLCCITDTASPTPNDNLHLKS